MDNLTKFIVIVIVIVGLIEPYHLNLTVCLIIDMKMSNLDVFFFPQRSSHVAFLVLFLLIQSKFSMDNLTNFIIFLKEIKKN